MGKKDKRPKKVNAKKEKYSKFKKEKAAVLDVKMPDLEADQMKQKQKDEETINRYLRFNRNAPPKEIVSRKAKSKR